LRGRIEFERIGSKAVRFSQIDDFDSIITEKGQELRKKK
jgi:hypothetical protein